MRTWMALLCGIALGILLAGFAQEFAFPVLPLSQVIASWTNPVSIDPDANGKINPQFIDEFGLTKTAILSSAILTL